VLFDATPAPVIYTSASQVAVMAPYDIAGKTTVDVSVEYNTVASPDVTMSVAAHSPALFTATGAGSGQAAVLNVDSLGAVTVNSETNAAPKGSVITLYATGEGVTTPASTDGSIVTTAAATPNPGISVQVGGKDAEILYTGGVPGLVSGIMQINARLATDTTAGKAVQIVLTMHGVSSPAGVTVGVK
jgi:uncharacterized protein (TIGR03437 family)